jgi:hypothetical protein
MKLNVEFGQTKQNSIFKCSSGQNKDNQKQNPEYFDLFCWGFCSFGCVFVLVGLN